MIFHVFVEQTYKVILEKFFSQLIESPLAEISSNNNFKRELFVDVRIRPTRYPGGPFFLTKLVLLRHIF